MNERHNFNRVGGKMIRFISKSVCLLVIVCFMVTNLTITYAQAAMVATETVIHSSQAENSRARLISLLNRQEVTEAFAKQGIDVEQAKKRVANLSDAEIAKINQKLDQLPAGGDGVGAVVGAIVLIFLVLLITDLVGLTHVFPFVNHPKR
jgi:hypothetical protein